MASGPRSPRSPPESLGGLRVVGIRGRTPPTRQRRPTEPLGTPIEWIRGRDGWQRWGTAVLEPARHRRRRPWERSREQWASGRELRVDRQRIERNHNGCQLRRRPAKRLKEDSSRRPIERHLALEPADVGKIALDLSEDSVAAPDRDQVHPSAWRSRADRYLGGDAPAGPLKASDDHAQQARMDRVPLLPPVIERAVRELQRAPDAHRGEQTCNNGNVRVRIDSALQPRDPGLRHGRPDPELLLGPAGKAASLPDQRAKPVGE